MGSVVAVIPSRYGSQRLRAKPLIDLCGKPMVQHVYERAAQAKLIDRVIIATDHEEIAKTVRGFGGEAVMTPESLRSGTDRVAFVAEKLSDAEIVVNVQGDEPLIDPRMIDQAVAPLKVDSAIAVGTLVKVIDDPADLANPSVVKAALDCSGFALYFSRSPIPHRRDEPDMQKWLAGQTYYKHIGLYVFRREFLRLYSGWEETPLERSEKLEQLRIMEHGYRIKAAVTEFDSIPIDTQDDVQKVIARMNSTT
ncbi:MAG TPA: 3-deoxy-manno-octulosonate cytidylyltransferase [Bacteroidota bacterium]|nr:3-deoxy-manno-octulosonate cytidylyltransferase [Bacteroidota bacterium]